MWSFTYITSDLLGKHVVVTFPSSSGQIVSVPWANAAEIAVTVTATSSSANL